MTSKEIEKIIKQHQKQFNVTRRTENVTNGANFHKKNLIQIAVNKLSQMIVITGLTQTLPRDEIEKNLILTGHCIFVEKYDKIWCPPYFKVYGGLETNVYQQSLQFIGASPVLGTFKGYDMIDGVISYNTDIDKDLNCSLLMQCIDRYATLISHCESTIINNLINKRIGRVGIASTSQLAVAMDKYLDNIENGYARTVQAGSAFVDEMQPLEFKDLTSLSDLTQARDYLINCFLNEIGLQTLEEKKERMITDELNVDAEVLNNNVYSYLKNRYIMCQKLNSFFGLDLKIIFRG